MATRLLLSVTVFMFVVFYGEAKMVDLTHRLRNVGMSYWPTFKKFRLTTDIAGQVGKYKWLAFNSFETAEHMGTHLDSPYHFKEKGRKIHEIPLEELHGPAVVVDIREKSKRNRHAQVLTQDLRNWEARFGRFPDNAFIMMNSGWGQYWGNQFYYVGSSGNKSEDFSFPGFSLEATEWLLKNRKSFRGLATDAVSCDTGNAGILGDPVHVTLLGAEKLCIENVANIDKIPENGAHIYAMPILIEDGTGAPIRLYALVDESMPSVGRTGLYYKLYTFVLVILILFTYEI